MAAETQSSHTPVVPPAGAAGWRGRISAAEGARPTGKGGLGLALSTTLGQNPPFQDGNGSPLNMKCPKSNKIGKIFPQKVTR